MMAAVEGIPPGSTSSQKMTAKVMRHKAQQFLTSRKYANNLVDIVGEWDDANTACILTVETIFVEALKRHDMYLEKTISLTISEPQPEIRYITWLRKCYEEVWQKLLSSMERSRPGAQLQAVSTAIKLMAEEGKSPLEPVGELGYYFPLHRLKPIMMSLLSLNRDNSSLVSRFQEITSYSDALYYTWKSLPSLTPKRQPKEIFIKNLLEFIHKLPLPNDNDNAKETADVQELLCGPQFAAGFTWDQPSARRSLNKVWSCVMHWELTPELHKQLLIVLLERVMPHLDKPVLLTDFLMDSLDAEGSIGLLALQGVFVLVTKHNLEYPNIFTKLYSMFEPEIFHTKYKARLFYLSDLFLSSTHLPEALVAAFAKRLTRLTLVAPPEDILIILIFVGNLLLRHPGLKRLIDHPQGGPVTITPESSGMGDPFLMEERDPLQSNALFSSLWEIKALQHHILPSVATAARFIRDPLSSVEYDMASVLERTGGHIFDREIKNKVKDIMLTFERPNSMSLPKGPSTSTSTPVASLRPSLPGSVNDLMPIISDTPLPLAPLRNDEILTLDRLNDDAFNYSRNSMDQAYSVQRLWLNHRSWMRTMGDELRLVDNLQLKVTRQLRAHKQECIDIIYNRQMSRTSVGTALVTIYRNVNDLVEKEISRLEDMYDNFLS